MSDFVSRGFSGRRRTPDELTDRLPPGQYAESGFPILIAGPTPDVARDGQHYDVRLTAPDGYRERFGPTRLSAEP